jgi:hypothetical protein
MKSLHNVSLSRRTALQIGGCGLFGLTMPRLLQAAEAAPRIHRAKSVIFLYQFGGPSHLDTFDPKPAAPLEYRGPFAPIATRTPGVHFTEMLPRLAQRSHLFTLVRTHATNESGHPEAGTVALTGFKEKPEPVKPNFGAIVARHRGHRGALPPFISLASGPLGDAGRRIEGYGGATLGGQYDPLLVGCSDVGEASIPALKLLDDLNPARITDRRILLAQLDAVPRTLDKAGLADWNHTYQQAYDLLIDPAARQAFDLSRESAPTRAAYGQSVFGQSALLARRLVEAGVPYVQLNYSRHVESINPGFEFGWDTHNYNFELLQDQHCPILDRAFSALLDDLDQRGLFDRTLVVCMGEFGRTPKISARASRDHWPPCYFSIWAGAGIEPNRVIGQSDDRGEYPLGEPVTPLMVGTTIAELAGLDSQARVELGVLPGGNVVEGLL